MKKILVMLTKTPYNNDENRVRLTRCQKDDVVIFAQDSVFSFCNPILPLAKLIQEKQSLGVRVFASLPDCQARGVTPFPDIKMVDYPEQVDLICECELSM